MIKAQNSVGEIAVAVKGMLDHSSQFSVVTQPLFSIFLWRIEISVSLLIQTCMFFRRYLSDLGSSQVRSGSLDFVELLVDAILVSIELLTKPVLVESIGQAIQPCHMLFIISHLSSVLLADVIVTKFLQGLLQIQNTEVCVFHRPGCRLEVVATAALGWRRNSTPLGFGHSYNSSEYGQKPH